MTRSWVKAKPIMARCPSPGHPPRGCIRRALQRVCPGHQAARTAALQQPASYNQNAIARSASRHPMNPDFKPDEIERSAQAAWRAGDAYRVVEDPSRPKF